MWDVVNIVVEIFWTDISLRELLRRDPGNITFQFNYEILLGRGFRRCSGNLSQSLQGSPQGRLPGGLTKERAGRAIIFAYPAIKAPWRPVS